MRRKKDDKIGKFTIHNASIKHLQQAGNIPAEFIYNTQCFY